MAARWRSEEPIVGAGPGGLGGGQAWAGMTPVDRSLAFTVSSWEVLTGVPQPAGRSVLLVFALGPGGRCMGGFDVAGSISAGAFAGTWGQRHLP